MSIPAGLNEPDAIADFVESQVKAIRAAAYRLTEQQARETPCRSGLSVGGLVKHATYGLTRYLRRMQAPGEIASEEYTPERYAEYFGSFALTDDETLEGVLADLDTAAVRYLAAVRAADPDRPTIQPPAPWDGRDEPSETVERVHLLHAVEEMARHAGHADILREQIDGATSAELQAALDGRPANAFVTPWQAPETAT